ncbi:MAG: hypothetical protein IT426_21265 [Pirellulales bacterium]|jgi:hypothetical protein|nr:hypothetical protein [Pirellulales bacterium]
MTREAMKIREMLTCIHRKLKADLNGMAKEVIQQPFDASQKDVSPSKDESTPDLERLRAELALRTMASGYDLLNRIEKALKPDCDLFCGPDRHEDETAAPYFVNTSA